MASGGSLRSAACVACVAEEVGGGDAGLFGGGEGVEGHVVGAVADGVEAELEAGGGAGGGHVVEVVLRVARDAGVGGVVGVGVVHGGGAGAEGAVHEAFEEGEVEEWVVGVVGGAAGVEDGDGEVEVDPLGDAEGEFVFVLELFVDEPVVPGGEVLDGGDAVGEGVGDGELEGLFAGVVGWAAGCVFRGGRVAGVSRMMPVGWPWASRSMWPPKGSGVEAVMPAAARAAVLATAMWPSTRKRKAGWPAVTGSRSSRVGRVLVGQLVWSQPPPRIHAFLSREGFGVGGDAGLHVGEGGGAVEVGGEAIEAGVGGVGVGVVEAGHGEGAVEVDLLGVGSGAGEDGGVGAGEDDAAGGDAEGLDALGVQVAVVESAGGRRR